MNRVMRAGWTSAICGAIILAMAPFALGQNSNQQGQNSSQQWTMGGHDLQNSRNQSGSGISSQNAGNLKLKWTFTTGGDVVATPAVVSGIVYFPDFAGNFYAVNANTGQSVWSKKVSDWTGFTGDFARNSPAIDGNMLFLGNQAGNFASFNTTVSPPKLSPPAGSPGALPGANVIAVNRSTGQLIWVTQVEAFPTAMVTSSPVVFNGVVYVGVASAEENTAANPAYNQCCISRGSVVALDEKTGAIKWKTYMVPDNGGSLGGYSGGGIWDTTPVIDPNRNSIYVGTGNNYSVPQGVKDCMNGPNPGPNCTDTTDYFDSVVALDLTTGKVKWATRALAYDAWNVACIFLPAGVGNCPNPEGPDFDFGGNGPNLLSVGGRDILGIGEKSGMYWALNPDNGSVIWKTLVGPGSSLGGVEWGTAYDGTRVYVPISNLLGLPYPQQPSMNGGSWAALDPATGKILWQTAVPGQCPSFIIPGATQGCMGLGPASVGNGVVFVGSMDTNPANPTMFALDAATGKVLWSYVAGSSVNAGPSIVGTTIFWGSGYGHLQGLGTGNTKLFAFTTGGDNDQQ